MHLSEQFFQQSTRLVAKNLLGCCLVHQSDEGLTAGLIVETEAYLSKNDPACHANRGKTKRNEVMFAAGGCAYVYLIYGLHYCFNVVTGAEGKGEAVLIRALEPIKGVELMKKRRSKTQLQELCSGPAKLAQALGLNKAQNGLSLSSKGLYISARHSGFQSKIVQTTRIGISEGAELKLRFYIKGSSFISRK